MSEEYLQSVEDFLKDSFKLSFEFPEFVVDKEKPELTMEFKEKKHKKEKVIREKTRDGRNKSKSSLF